MVFKKVFVKLKEKFNFLRDLSKILKEEKEIEIEEASHDHSIYDLEGTHDPELYKKGKEE